MAQDWPEELTRKLRWLWGQYSTAQIGRILGVSKNAVIGRAHRLRLEKLPSPIIRKGDPRPPKLKVQVQRVTTESLPPLPSAVDQAMAEFTAIMLPPPVSEPIKPANLRFCCWPTSDGRPWTFCEAPCRGNYCEHHARAAVGKGTAKERRSSSAYNVTQ